MVVPVKDTVGLFAEEARSTCQSQCGQARAPRSSYRDVVQPVDDPSYVYPRRGGQLLKAGLLQAPVASLAQPEGSYSLRNRPFYACPPGVETSELFGFLADWIASCSSWGCRVRVRGRSLARVHEDRLGHALQSSGEKSMWIILPPE